MLINTTVILNHLFYTSVIFTNQLKLEKNLGLHLHQQIKQIVTFVKFRAGLSLGGSRHWKDVLETMTGERNLNASAILEYFQPLYDFLKQKNSERNPQNQTVPIVVGCILGGLLIIILGVYIYKKRMRK